MARLTGNFGFGQHNYLGTIVCAFFLCYSFVVCVVAGNPTVTAVAIDAAQTVMVEWCYPCMCQLLMCLSIGCCLTALKAPKNIISYIMQAPDSLMPALPMTSAAVAFLQDCTVSVITGTLYLLVVARERCTITQATRKDNPNDQQPEHVRNIAAQSDLDATSKCLSVVTIIPASTMAAEVNAFVPETPERRSEAWDGNSQPELTEVDAVTLTTTTTSSSSSSSTRTSSVAARAAAYEHKLAMSFVSTKPQVTAALPGTVDYFRWSFELRIEACNMCTNCCCIEACRTCRACAQLLLHQSPLQHDKVCCEVGLPASLH